MSENPRAGGDLGELHRSVRAPGAIVLGVAAIVVGGFLVVMGFTGQRVLRAVGAGGLVILAGYYGFVRPRLGIHARGLDVVNPFTRTRLSYAGLDGVSLRWNLTMLHGEHTVTAFALPREGRRRAASGSRAGRAAESLLPDDRPTDRRATVRIVHDELVDEMDRRARSGDGGEPAFVEHRLSVAHVASAAVVAAACLVLLVIG